MDSGEFRKLGEYSEGELRQIASENAAILRKAIAGEVADRSGAAKPLHAD